MKRTPLNGLMGRFRDDPRTIAKADGPRARWPTGTLFLPRLGYFSFHHRQKLSPTSAQARWQVFVLTAPSAVFRRASEFEVTNPDATSMAITERPTCQSSFGPSSISFVVIASLRRLEGCGQAVVVLLEFAVA